MSETSVNGEKPTSLTVNHITSYPLPADLINIYEKNPLGAKSISVFQHFYSALSHNLFPYLKTPYSIVAPYLQQADHLGTKLLSNIDERFPAIKETDLDALRSHAHDAAFFPFKVAGQSKDYVFSTYSDEYEKVGGNDGVVRTVKSVISTNLRIAKEGLSTVAEYLGPKKDEAVKKYEELKEQAGPEFEKMKQLGLEKLKQGKNAADYYKAQSEKVASEKKQEVEQKGHEMSNGE